jgi:hypothetical protein
MLPQTNWNLLKIFNILPFAGCLQISGMCAYQYFVCLLLSERLDSEEKKSL